MLMLRCDRWLVSLLMVNGCGLSVQIDSELGLLAFVGHLRVELDVVEQRSFVRGSPS